MVDPCPGLGVIAIVIALVVIFRLWQSKSLFSEFADQDAGQTVPLPDPRLPATDLSRERMGFGSIRYADPHFDLDAFYARVSEMFLAYHAAVDDGDLKPARRFIDERYYPALLRDLEAAKTSASAGQPFLGPLVVESTRAMTANHESGMDMVRVIVTAHRGPETGPHVQEYWTLIRRQGAITKADLSLYKCPNCGAPTDGDDPTRCGYCGARLADPALDWVVTRIRND